MIVNPSMVNALTGRVIDSSPNIGGAINTGLANAGMIEKARLLREKMRREQTAERRQAEIQRMLAAADTPEAKFNALMSYDPGTAIQYQNSNLAVDKFGAEQAVMGQRNAFFDTLMPEEQAFARAFPDDFAGQYAKNAFGMDAEAAPEYGLNPLRTIGPDGNPTLFQISKGGGIKPVDLPEGYTFSTGTGKVDLGTGWAIIDNMTGEIAGVIPKDIEGEEEAKARGRTAGERQANKPKAVQAFRDLKRQWGIVLQDIDKALEDTNFWTSGWVGRLTDAVPGTPAYNLARTLETVKANIGFDKLQSMRDNSPTGGALGQVSEFENRLLQAVQGSLEQGQSAEQLRDNLERIRLNLKGLEADRAQAFEQTYNEPLSLYIDLAPSKVPMIGSGPAPGTEDAGNMVDYSMDDLEFTARKYGLTVDEVKQRLGVQ